MRYAVDPRLVVDVLNRDPEWGERVARLLDAHRDDALVLAPLAYLSLAPAFSGRRRQQDEFLAGWGISISDNGQELSLDAAYDACSLCRQDGPDVDGGYMSFGVLSSGAVALTCDGILTRHGGLYRRYFPSLKVIEP